MSIIKNLISRRNLVQKLQVTKRVAGIESPELLEKGRKADPIGTVRNGHKKVAEGKWLPVKTTLNKKQSAVSHAQDVIKNKGSHAEVKAAIGKVNARLKAIGKLEMSSKLADERDNLQRISKILNRAKDIGWQRSSSDLKKKEGTGKPESISAKDYLDAKTTYYNKLLKEGKTREQAYDLSSNHTYNIKGATVTVKSGKVISDVVIKSDYEDDFALLGVIEGVDIEKGRKMPIGTVSGNYKKVAEGKWVPVKKDGGKKKNEPNPSDRFEVGTPASYNGDDGEVVMEGGEKKLKLYSNVPGRYGPTISPDWSKVKTFYEVNAEAEVERTKKNILKDTKEINSLKVKRNKFPKGSSKRKKLQATIDRLQDILDAKKASINHKHWHDAETGDLARVKSINRSGVITGSYGRKFNIKFTNGIEKTFDASDLEIQKSSMENDFAILGVDTLEKARSGRYQDNAQNKKLGRVGQEYGSKKKEEEPGDKKPKKEGSEGGKKSTGEGVDNHAVAHLTHMKKVAETDPGKAYEIYQSLSPEAQKIVPQDVVNKLVEAHHTPKEDAKWDDLEKLGVKKDEGGDKRSDPKKKVKETTEKKRSGDKKESKADFEKRMGDENKRVLKFLEGKSPTKPQGEGVTVQDLRDMASNSDSTHHWSNDKWDKVEAQFNDIVSFTQKPTAEDKAYFKENREELLKISEEELFMSMKQIIDMHRENKKGEGSGAGNKSDDRKVTGDETKSLKGSDGDKVQEAVNVFNKATRSKKQKIASVEKKGEVYILKFGDGTKIEEDDIKGFYKMYAKKDWGGKVKKSYSEDLQILGV